MLSETSAPAAHRLAASSARWFGRLAPVLSILCLLAGSAMGATFTVTSGLDTHDANPGDGVCADTSTPAVCTLRAAIEEGNALAGTHIINFTPGLVVTVGALGSMAQMRAPFIVNGNLAMVDGQYVSGSSIGYGCLDLTDSGDPTVGHANGAVGSIISNLSIVRCNGAGISSNGHGYTYLNNRIGVDPTGLIAMPNSGHGMDLTASAYYPDNTTLQNIYNLLPPSLQPVDFSQINQFEIGLANALVASVAPIYVTGNVISGNDQNGIEVHGINMAAVLISGNHIGTNISGTAALPNGGSGVHLNASAFGNMVGPGNVISGNAVNGILADSSDVLLPNFIMGNRIGLGDDSTQHVGNGVSGIVTDTKPAGASPGPPNPSGVALMIGPGNLISDNQGTNNPNPDDVSSESGAGIVITGASSGVKVLGNTIGLAEFPTGTPVASKAYGNAGDGVLVTVSGNTVGGSSSGSANVIAGNLRHGIVVKGSATAGTTIQGNSIGVSPSFPGQTTLGNGLDGIHVDAASASNVGGANAGEANVIAANGRNGIALRNGSSSNGWGNLFQRNSVFGNSTSTAGIGIDLERTLNAADDPLRTEIPANYANGDQVQPVVCAGPSDTGACNGSSAPASSGGTTTLDWTITTHAGGSFRLEVFSVNGSSDNAATRASFLGEATFTTDASGNLVSGTNATCTGTGPGRCTTTLSADAGGSSLVLTVTDVKNLPVLSGDPGFGWYGPLSCFLSLSTCPVNNTSELSNAVAVPLPAGPVMATVPPQAGKVGVFYALDLSTFVNPNGSPITSYGIAAGALPPSVGLNASTGLVSGTPTTAGSFTATINATNANGTTHAPAIPFTIAKGDQVITFGVPPSLVAGGAAKSVAATVNSGLALTFSSLTTGVCTVAGNMVTPLAVGTCTIAADQAGDANWNAAPEARQSISVIAVAGTPPTWSASFPATQSGTVGVAFSLALSTYAVPNAAGDPFVGYAVVSGALPAGLHLDTALGVVSGTPTAATAAPVTVGFTVNDQNGASPIGSIQFTIGKGSQSINFGALSNRVAGSGAFTVFASATSGLAVSFSTPSLATVCTVVGNQVTPVGPGTCTVHATQAGDTNWNAAAPVDQSFTVTAATVSDFLVSAPASATVAAPFSVTVTARDSGASTVVSYNGTVHFTSTDGTAGLPADYTFVAGDAGVHTFTNVRLNTAGSWTVTAADTVLSGVTGTSGSITVTAGSAAALSGLITAKSGAANARAWTITVTNGGPGGAYSTRIDSLTLTQTAGAACTPIVASTFPVAVGDIAPSASAGAPVVVDFTGCPLTAQFRADIGFSANVGADTGSRTLYHQFQ